MFGILHVKINFIAGILSEKHEVKKSNRHYFGAMGLKPRERKYSTRSPNTRRY
jgi:hypothetical protein